MSSESRLIDKEWFWFTICLVATLAAVGTLLGILAIRQWDYWDAQQEVHRLQVIQETEFSRSLLNKRYKLVEVTEGPAEKPNTQ